MTNKDFGERYHVAALTMIVDFFIVALSAYFAFWVRGAYLEFNDEVFVYNSVEYLVLTLLFAVILLFTSLTFGVYVSWRGKRFYNLASSVLMSWVTASLIMFTFLFLSKLSIQYSRPWVVLWFVMGFTLSIVVRYVARQVLQKIRRTGVNKKHIVVVGCADACKQVSLSLSNEPQYGFNIQDTYFIDKNARFNEIDVQNILNIVQETHCKELWICLPLSMGQYVQDIMHGLRHVTVNIRYVPDWSGFQLLNHDVAQIADFYMFNLNCSPMTNTARRMKDIEDKLLGSLILFLSSPLMLAIALAVKISSPGPIFYRQERVGWNGKTFVMYKFRSMPVNVENKSGPVWANGVDQRATTIGKFLRKTSLDELPQFFNVLKGDMSIVGPRPERKYFVEKYKDNVPGYMKKHLVKAGVTGWAQVNGWRGNTSLQKRIEHDLYYIENWSLFLDLKIIWMTLFKGFVHKNAY